MIYIQRAQEEICTIFFQAEMKPLLCDSLTVDTLGPHASPNLRKSSAANTDLLSHNTNHSCNLFVDSIALNSCRLVVQWFG